jgi:hypothetical protein
MVKKLGLSIIKEHRLGVFENRKLKRIFGLKGNYILGGWKKSA